MHLSLVATPNFLANRNNIMLGPWPIALSEEHGATGSPTEWLRNFGHDTYAYPLWVQHQQLACECKPGGMAATCHTAGTAVDWRAAVRTSPLGAPLTWCIARAWLLDHMPEFDKRFLPPSITVNGSSMLDDQLAFALMADAAAGWAGSLPLSAKLAYILPYATTHESRQNWRPLFFAKFVHLVRGATTVEQAMDRLLADPNLFQWSSHFWEDSPVQPPTTAAAAAAGDAAAADAAAPTAAGAGAPDERAAPLRQWSVEWSSSTNPPVTAPLDAVAYGYSSCTGMATLVAYVARAVGIPARVVGAPCWNSGPFAGLASHNPNVSQCWHGGSARQHGSGYLYNHNWVEVFTPSAVPRSGGPWSLLNVPLPSTFTPGGGGEWMCPGFAHWSEGCSFNASAPPGHECDGAAADGHGGAAMRDHEIFAFTWAEEADETAGLDEGGEIVEVAQFRLSSGEPASPLVWAPALADAYGVPLRTSLRLVNRTAAYRCKPSRGAGSAAAA